MEKDGLFREKFIFLHSETHFGRANYKRPQQEWLDDKTFCTDRAPLTFPTEFKGWQIMRLLGLMLGRGGSEAQLQFNVHWSALCVACNATAMMGKLKQLV